MNKTLENFLRDTLDAKVLKIENQVNIYTKLDLSIFKSTNSLLKMDKSSKYLYKT